MESWLDKRTVLLVTDREEIAQAVALALDEEMYDVLRCTGPHAPEYQCLGTTGQDCPLARVAGAVILDLDLDCDIAGIGGTSLELLDYYTGRGVPVIAISHDRSMLARGDLWAVFPPWGSTAELRARVGDVWRKRATARG